VTPPPTVDELRERARAKLTKGELRALTAELRREVKAEMVAPVKTPRVRETPEMAQAARRMIRAVADRAALDIEGLPLLAELSGYVDEQTRRAVDQLRSGEQLQGTGYSWADVGRVLGQTRQAVQQRFSR
jgi:3,4-dihydroxy-2-butanone 4-phosphate synthase